MTSQLSQWISNVLVVDDDGMICQIIGLMLHSEGIASTLVDDERDAVTYDRMVIDAQDANGGGRHHVQMSTGSGTATSISVPMPIDDVIRTLPPTCWARSRMVCSPK